jgi:hypothetical protein
MRITNSKWWLPATVMGALLVTTPAPAQEGKPAPTPAPQADASRRDTLGPLVPLDVQVVVNRYQGDKRVSSLPYSLAVNANDRTVSGLRMGARVPVQRGATAPPNLPPVEYQSIGTNIDCFARTMDDGRFQVNIVIEDSSIYENVPGAVQPSTDDKAPVFRSFKSTNTLVLRDGQTRQFTAATDRVNGEVVRIEVTLRVVK